MPTWPITSIRALLEPTLEHMGYDLYAIEQSGQSGRTLRVSIDRIEPIRIEDCERVSRVIGPLLDNASLIPGPYDLEVSSPGAERPLRGKEDYQRFNGKRVNVRYRTGQTETVVEGQLVAVFNLRRWHSDWKKTYYSNNKAKKLLGWQPLVPAAEGLRRYFESCRAGRRFA